ncbi:hypothetical protein DL765_004390 [Monosporascus sp. GIB2]|nr:hypothetical protein DL765_004390 [Monosporascus sp. GIB2]
MLVGKTLPKGVGGPVGTGLLLPGYCRHGKPLESAESNYDILAAEQQPTTQPGPTLDSSPSLPSVFLPLPTPCLQSPRLRLVIGGRGRSNPDLPSRQALHLLLQRLRANPPPPPPGEGWYGDMPVEAVPRLIYFTLRVDGKTDADSPGLEQTIWTELAHALP